MSDVFDVVIIGGGPAGSLLASLVRRDNPGRRVLIVEKEIFPRHHIGESTIPSWRNILARAGVLASLEAAGFMRKVGTLFQWGASDDERWTIDFRDKRTGGASPGGYQVDRAKFDQALLDHARSLGVDVRQGATVKAAASDGEGFVVSWDQAGEQHSTTTRFLIDASGQSRVLARLWSLPVVPFDDMNNFAVYGYWRGSETACFAGPPIHQHERWTYISTSKDGWVWHIPTFPDLVSVGVVTDADAIPPGGPAALADFYLRNVRGSEGIGELLARAELVEHPLLRTRLSTVRDWAYRVGEVCGPGWFLVGDAAAFVDPILSSGLLIAANGASLAANALNTIWNDPEVDLSLLRESYRATYNDMAESYHRMARVWYKRNFKYSTWHWEAKRQRLRTGRHPAQETDARAFMQLCIGSFSNPVEGTFADRGHLVEFLRADARIYAAHLFKGEAPFDKHGAVDEIGREEIGEDEVRRRIEGESRTRWKYLLDRRVTVQRCRGSARDGYFTDSTMDHWQRVRYLEVFADPKVDPFDRVVFPVTTELPAGVLPFLLRDKQLRNVLRQICARHPLGSTEYQSVLKLMQQQVLQLDLRGWLEISGDPPPAQFAGSWPAPIEDVVHRLPGAWAEMDLLGDSISLSLSNETGIVLAAAARAHPNRTWKQTATTAFSYRGDFSRVGRVAEHLLQAMRGWEPAHPDFWNAEAPALAGHAVHIGDQST
jgi:flavin-dependent dehydrogenase